MDKKGILNLKEKVEFCLENYPETRNSDIELTTRIWRVYHSDVLHLISFGNNVCVMLKDLVKLPREDNVKRVRATIQNKEGRFLPTDWEVAKKRKINEEVWREAMSRYGGIE